MKGEFLHLYTQFEMATGIPQNAQARVEVFDRWAVQVVNKVLFCCDLQEANPKRRARSGLASAGSVKKLFESIYAFN